MNPLIVARIVGCAALALLAFVGGWKVNGWRYEAQKAATAVQAASELKAATDARDALAVQLKASNDARLAAIQKAQDAENALRDRVASGNVRLRIAAHCPNSVPQAASSPGMDSGAGPELDPAARPAYFALRTGILAIAGRLAACQDELRLRADGPSVPP